MDARADEARGLGATEYFPAQLYNLAEDPSESTNVLEANPDIVAELVEILSNHIRPGRSTPGENHVNAPYSATGRWHQIGWMN